MTAKTKIFGFAIWEKESIEELLGAGEFSIGEVLEVDNKLWKVVNFDSFTVTVEQINYNKIIEVMV